MGSILTAGYEAEEKLRADENETATSQTVAAADLRAIIERIERLESDKADIVQDIKQVLAEAKGKGYDTTAIRKLVALRKLDEAERQEAEAILDLYKEALGMAA